MPRNESALLQMIEHYVARGSYFYVTGSTTSDNVVPLTEKFARRYPTILATSRERTAAKKLKAVRVRLFWWPERFIGQWSFLLVSDQPLQDEKMADCRRASKRILIVGQSSAYVNTRRANGAWTWQLNEYAYSSWRERLGTAARSGRVQLLQEHVDQLLRATYMAGGVRVQVFSLLNEANRIYQNNRKSDVDLVIPKNIVKARRMKWHSSPPVTLPAAIEARREMDNQALIDMRMEWELHVQRAADAGWPI